MNNIFITCVLCLFAAGLTVVVQGQSTPATTGTTQNSSAAPSKVAESIRLSQKVVQLYKEGKYAAALPLAERALALSEQSFAPSHLNLTVALNNLAAVLVELKKIDRARLLYERVLSIHEAQARPDLKEINRVRERLAIMYYRKGDYSKAESMFTHILANPSPLQNGSPAENSAIVTGLAFVYLAQGEGDKLSATLTKLIEIAKGMPKPLPKYFENVFDAYQCSWFPRGEGAKEKQNLLSQFNAMAEGKEPVPRSEKKGGVLNGRAVSRPQPSYPLEARTVRVQGTVIVKVTVDETGKVIEAAAICGPPLLHEASEATARNWRFTPALLDGQPVKVTGTISFNFQLR
ncbi:MAG: TonB family protein [Pyrinomonadaceae bacterium]